MMTTKAESTRKAKLRELHEHLALMVRYFEAEAREGDGIAEVHFDGYQAAKALLVRTAVDQPQWENAQIEISELLREAAYPARAEPAGGWVLPDGEDSLLPAPELESFSWVVWNGVIQDQPWQWVTSDDEEDRFTFEGRMLFLDEIDAYWPIVFPAPPAPPSHHPNEVKP